MKRISLILMLLSLAWTPSLVLAQKLPPDPILEGIAIVPLPDTASNPAGAAVATAATSNPQDPILAGIAAAEPTAPLPATTGGMQNALGAGLCAILASLLWATARKEGVV